jgi:hypothetical protein
MGTLIVCLLVLWQQAAASQAQPTPPIAKPCSGHPGAEGIPVDEFMDTMGMFAAATAGLHHGCQRRKFSAGGREAFAVATPMIQKARQMVVMMNAINRTYFARTAAGDLLHVPLDTSNPQRVPNLSIQRNPPSDNPNTMDFITLPASPISRSGLRQYIQALAKRSDLPPHSFSAGT